jgi:hypothetical protein
VVRYPSTTRASRHLPPVCLKDNKGVQLFEPVVDETRMHPNFRGIVGRGNVYNLDVLNDWARGCHDREGKFIHEFQTTFNSSFWELYLFAMLKK